jgi:hypothetical protein
MRVLPCCKLFWMFGMLWIWSLNSSGSKIHRHRHWNLNCPGISQGLISLSGGGAAPWNGDSFSQPLEGVASLLGVILWLFYNNIEIWSRFPRVQTGRFPRVQTASSDREWSWDKVSKLDEWSLNFGAAWWHQLVAEARLSVMGLWHAGSHVMDAALRDKGSGYFFKF